MKYYVIVDKKFTYRGYTVLKEVADLFLSQRTEGNYVVEVIEDNKKNKSLIKALVDSYDELGVVAGFALFPSENEYMYESFDQMIIDIQCRIIDILKDVIPYLRLEDKERETVDRYLYAMYDHLKKYSYGDDDDPEDIYRRFDYVKMAKVIVDTFD